MAVKVGDQFGAIHADSYATWQVTEKRGRGTWIAQIVSDDWTGVEKAFTTQDIEGSMRAEAHSRADMDDHDSFYANLKVGQIVHYDGAFHQFTRCEVVLGNGRADADQNRHGKALKPIALVGRWDKHDLPHRMPNGDIIEGYHAKAIREGKLMEPHYGNIYEARPRGDLDPRNLPAVDLSVPDMTDAEKNEADLVRLVSEIEKLCGHADWDSNEKPKTAKQKLRAITKLVNSERAKRHLA